MTWVGYIEKNNVKPKDITDAIEHIKTCNHCSNKMRTWKMTYKSNTRKKFLISIN